VYMGGEAASMRSGFAGRGQFAVSGLCMQSLRALSLVRYLIFRVFCALASRSPSKVLNRFNRNTGPAIRIGDECRLPRLPAAAPTAATAASATVSTASAAMTAAITASASGVLSLGARFVDVEGAPSDLRSV